MMPDREYEGVHKVMTEAVVGISGRQPATPEQMPGK
jgi:hypothetical protein